MPEVRAGGVVEHLPSKCEALSSIPSTTTNRLPLQKKKKKKKIPEE
jgi:hypothetical protein